MAGSLNHIIDDDGKFKFNTIENLGDAHEMGESCFDIIADLLEQIESNGGDPKLALKAACFRSRAPVPDVLPRFGERTE